MRVPNVTIMPTYSPYDDGYANGYADGYADRDKEIVRCKDCRHYVPFMNECDYPDGNGDFLRIIVPPEHFCAWGERRDA